MTETDYRWLGKNSKVPFEDNAAGLNGNVMVCGCTGSGKTMSIVEPTLLATENHSLILTVTKKKLIAKYSDLFVTRGYQVYILDLVDLDSSTVTWDPLSELQSFSDIRSLSEKIVQLKAENHSYEKDSYWPHASSALLQALIGFIMASVPHPTIQNVMNLISRITLTKNNPSKGIDEMFDLYENCVGPDEIFQAWKSFQVLPDTTAGCVLGMTTSYLNLINIDFQNQSLHSVPLLPVEKLGEEKSILFIRTSPVSRSMDAYVSLLYDSIFTRLFMAAEQKPEGQLPVPVHLICDDFATGSKIPDFAQKISIFREKGISVTILIQSESQLTDLYQEADAHTILNNCDTYIYLGGCDLLTAENISIRVNRPLNTVLEMPVGKEYIFRRGSRPVYTDRYPIQTDKIWQEISR